MDAGSIPAASTNFSFDFKWLATPLAFVLTLYSPKGGCEGSIPRN